MNVLDGSSAAGTTLENTATVACPAGLTERNELDNIDTDINTLWEVLFIDGFESGDTSAW